MGRERAVRRLGAALLSGIGLVAATGAGATDKEALPVPRFVSMRHDVVNVRVGPGMRYPIAWVYTKLDMPVEITQEYQNWRKIRDYEGTEGWVNALELQGKRFVIIQGAIRAIRDDPAEDAEVVARAEPGVLARLDKCPADTMGWCRIEVADRGGWVRRSDVWGVFPNEIYPTP